MTYLFIDNQNRVVGTSSVMLNNCVKSNIKPFSVGKARWNGEKVVYDYPSVEHKKTERNELWDNLIFSFGNTFCAKVTFLNGKEFRDHNGQISVLIPCYGKSDYVTTAVRSCLKQTQKPTQILVLLMDEKSQALKDELEGLSDIVKCFCESRMNVCKARTYLAEKCKTDWLIFLDADDFLLRDFIKVLDSKKETFCMGNDAYTTEKNFTIRQCEENNLSFNKKENILQKNMTALMHRDVFFDIGLNEKYASGAEDLDFLMRLASSRKWSFSFDSSPLWVYRLNTSNSLSKAEAFYKSYYEVLKDNKEIIMRELEDVEYDTPEVNELLYFLDNPSEGNFRKLAVFRAFHFAKRGHEKFYSEFVFFEDYVRNEFNYFMSESMKRDTEYCFNANDYIAINCDKKLSYYLSDPNLRGTSFDAVIFNCSSSDVENLIVQPLSYIVRKDIQKDIEEKGLSKIDTIFFLLKNYSCFIKNNTEECEKMLLTSSNDFILALDNVKFDKTIEESALFLRDTLTYGLFYTKPVKKRRAITFVLHKKCNMKCPYCPQSDKSDPLSDDEIFANFDKALSKFEKELGQNFTVQVMGGETTLWSDYLQHKILHRCEGYKRLHIFTNGTNKECPLYKDERVVKHLHLLNWKKQIYETALQNELYDVIIEDNDYEGIEMLKTYNGNNVLHILPQKVNGCSDLNMSYEFLKKLGEINNPKVLNSHIKNFIQEVDESGYEQSRSICRNGKRPVAEVDCTKMKVRPCSNSRFEYDFDDYDFTKLTPQEECDRCMFTY